MLGEQLLGAVGGPYTPVGNNRQISKSLIYASVVNLGPALVAFANSCNLGHGGLGGHCQGGVAVVVAKRWGWTFAGHFCDTHPATGEVTRKDVRWSLLLLQHFPRRSTNAN